MGPPWLHFRDPKPCGVWCLTSEQVWIDFKKWCTDTKTPCSISMFSVSNVNMKTASNYPLLHAKAANTRTLVAWLALVAVKTEADNNPGDTEWQMRALCCWALAKFYSCMDGYPRYLSRCQADEMGDVLQEFLDVYSALAKECETKGVNQWHLVPKFHYMCHLVLDIKSGQINPKYHHCFCDEDFVGRIGRGSRRLHRTSVVRGVMERYINLLVTRWRKAAV